MAATGAYIIVSGVATHADEGGFVSTCPDLDISSQGESVEEALTSLREAIDIFLDALAEGGQLGSYLKDHGIAFYMDKPKSTQVSVAPGAIVSSFVAAVDRGLIAV